jgi:aspartate kinase
MVNRAARLMEEMYPEGQIRLHNLAIVSAIGSHMKVKGILARTVTALAEAGINVMALHQSIRQVEMQCVVSEDEYEKAIIALHAALIENGNQDVNSAA